MAVVLADWEAVQMRIGNEIKRIEERRDRVTALLEEAKIPYALIGGIAVGYWVGSIAPPLARNTRNVDILLRRADLPQAQKLCNRPDLFSGTFTGWICFWTGRTVKRLMPFTCCLRVKLSVRCNR
jgi:hypothetical protein